MATKKKKIKVVELFAGVGGFRIGLDKASGRDTKYDVVWSSQWEPGAVTQHASEIYIKHFGSEGHSCEDIQKVVENDFESIPDHDLLVGGFPCQDYSVARTLSQAAGLGGTKGVLWWSIHNILKGKGKKAPNYLMLENVDRLLKSPAKQRGRDFAVMLASLADLGYAVEWRVINAAEYGFPQRRRRVFILGYKKGTQLYKQMQSKKTVSDWIHKTGVIAKAFPVEKGSMHDDPLTIDGSLADVTQRFSQDEPKLSPFANAGLLIGRDIYTVKVTPKYKGSFETLGDVIHSDETKTGKEFYLSGKENLEKWKKFKGGKTEKRTTKDGHTYNYSEGAMIFPDSLDRASRTIVTGEGGSGPSRFKHVIQTKKGKRRLTPVELERLNMFDDGHTEFMADGTQVSDTKRAFIMGNALVVGVITELGKSLRKFTESE